NEAAGGGVDDELVRLRGGGDQAADQPDRLDVRMDAAVDLLGPAIPDSMIPPGRARPDWFLLQYDQIVAASASTLTVSARLLHVVPSDQINGLEKFARDAEVIALTQTISIGPEHEIAGRLEDSRALDATSVDVVVAHRGQFGAPSLTFTFIAELQFVQHAAVLWIEEHQRRAAVRQRLQQRERIAVLRNIPAHGYTFE